MRQPDPLLRRRLIIVLIISLVIFAIADHFALWNIDQWFEGLQGGALADRVQLLLNILFLPLIPFGLFVIYFGLRVINSGQFPPPGSRVIKATETQTGTQARFRGWLAVVTGLGLCGLAWYGAVFVPHELQQLLYAQ